jgi:hypothetical protein
MTLFCLPRRNLRRHAPSGSSNRARLEDTTIH